MTPCKHFHVETGIIRQVDGEISEAYFHCHSCGERRKISWPTSKPVHHVPVEEEGLAKAHRDYDEKIGRAYQAYPFEAKEECDTDCSCICHGGVELPKDFVSCRSCKPKKPLPECEENYWKRIGKAMLNRAMAECTTEEIKEATGNPLPECECKGDPFDCKISCKCPQHTSPAKQRGEDPTKMYYTCGEIDAKITRLEASLDPLKSFLNNGHTPTPYENHEALCHLVEAVKNKLNAIEERLRAKKIL